MFSSRNATITRSEGKVIIRTFAKWPFLEILRFMSWAVPWLAFGVFVLLGVAGQISPETMTTGTRVFLVIWLILWISIGGNFVWDGFLIAFSTLEILADANGITLKRRFPFGSKTRTYVWREIEFVSEYVTDGRPYGGVVMHTGGRVITLDAKLPNRIAAGISRSIMKVWPTDRETES